MNSFILSAIIFLFFFLPLNGQFKNVVFDRITKQEGFNGQSCSCFLQDHLGFIWIGGVGIHKYDGYKFTHQLALPGCKNCPPTWNHYIKKMVEDDAGLIWMLTVNGVAIYNPGKERTILLNTSHMFDYNNYYNSYTGDILKDSEGNFWASGEGGLLKICLKSWVPRPVADDMIFKYGPDSLFNIKLVRITEDRNSNENKVQSLCEDLHGNIWVGTKDGLYILKKRNDRFIRIDLDDNGETRLAGREVRDVLQYDEDSLWIATNSGLTMITDSGHFLHDNDQGKISTLIFSSYLQGYGVITSLLKDLSGNLLIGTSGDLYIMKKNEKEGLPSFDLVYKNLKDLSAIGYNNGVQAMMQDREGEIWVAHNFDYLMKFNLKKACFTSYDEIIKKNFRHYEAISLIEDGKNNLWAGTYLGDLFRISSTDLRVSRFNPGTWNPIWCLIQSGPDKLMLGLEWGISEFDILKGTFSDPFPYSSRESVKLKKGRVNSLLMDGNTIYISSNNGIFVFDRSIHTLLESDISKNDTVSGVNDRYYQFVKSDSGEIWVTSVNKGLLKVSYDRENSSLSAVPYESEKFSNLNILGAENVALLQDNDSILWIGNQHLQKINIKTGDIRSFQLVNDIDYIGVYSILEDDNENFWMGTGFGLCRFNKRSGESRLFTEKDGWPIKGHTYLNAFKCSDGKMYFGGEGGFYSFHPDSIKTDNYIAPVVITDFRLMNKHVRIDSAGNGILASGISYSGFIGLNHNQNDISFEFAALDYSNTLKNKYAYKLEGYQNDWIETDAENRTATFTNLNPGKYTFRVKGSNSDGIWNETGTSLSIRIRSPWWDTPVAWSLYALFFFIFLTIIIRWRTWRLEKEKSEIEALVKIQTRQVEKQNSEILAQKNLLEAQNRKIIDLDQVKSRFFTNISHEFRTPLSLIQGPVEDLLENPRRTKEERSKLNVIYRNSIRLLNLVNQLLDISKIDSSKMKLELIEYDLMSFFRSLTASFNSLAETKDISFRCLFPGENVKTWFDPDKCEKVVTNLLTNAFKFTDAGGKIIFSANYAFIKEQVPAEAQITVEDNGCGIPEESLDKIFDRFYQVEESVRKESGGAGIGLSLVNDLVQLMHGEIKVSSKPGKGSTFSVRIPLGTQHLDKNEYGTLTDIQNPFMTSYIYYPEEEYSKEKEDEFTGKKPVILLVEDNIDIRTHISENLELKYNIRTASDGVVGLKKAFGLIPDLIITDLMMPFMDGLDMCKRLKSDVRTSHIPVIMLTAKVTMADKITGLETGADDYIPKPFHMAELKARVFNLIEQRKILRERFSKELNLHLSDITVTSVDEIFLRKAVKLVEQHINDQRFDLIMFRERMNMSSSTLFRKLHALTNQSPTEFIRTLRLKRAASLLSQNFGNVTQISLEVGFNNLSYFNKSFKKMFGVSPSEYAKSNHPQ